METPPKRRGWTVRSAEQVMKRAEQKRNLEALVPKHIHPDATYNEKGWIIVKRSLRGAELPPRPPARPLDKADPPLTKPTRKLTFDHNSGVLTMAQPLNPTQRLIQDYVDRHHGAGPDDTTSQRVHTQDRVRKAQNVISRWNSANAAMWSALGGRK